MIQKELGATILAVLMVLSVCGAFNPLTSQAGGDNSRSTDLYALLGTTPTIDGYNYTGDKWTEAVSDSVAFSGGTLRIAAKHDGTNLFILIECIDTSGTCVEDLFFEDDGISPDHTLDSTNEDCKYVGVSGFPDGFRDAHWDAGWSVGGEFGAQMNGAAESHTTGTTIVEEWWLPLNTGDLEDINVTSNEDLGFGVGWSGGWPDSSVGPYDPSGWGDLHVVFSGVNHAPSLDIISPSEGAQVTGIFTVKAIASDPDPGDTVKSVVMSVNSGAWQSAVKSGSTWNTNIDTAGYTEGQKLNIQAKASDGYLDSAIDQVNVTVHLNYPPVSDGPIPDQSFDEDTVLLGAIDLDNYFHDPDAGQLLKYTWTGNKHVHVTIDKGNVLNFSADQNWNGNELLTIRASDGSAYVEAKMKVVVRPVDDPPMVALIPDVLATEDISYVLDLSTYISDVDSPGYVISLTTDSKYAKVSVFTLTFNYPNGVLEERLNVTVTDGTSKVNAPVHAIVSPVNDAPTISSPVQIVVTEDIPFNFDLWCCTSDVDNPQTDLKYSFNQTNHLVKNKDGHTITFLYPNGIRSEDIELRVFDGLLWTMGVIRVTVTPVNDPPTIAIDNVTVTETETVVLNPTINDVDTPMNELRLTYSGAMKSNRWVTGYDDAGSHIVDVTVYDGEFSITRTITVTVLNKNRAPTVVLGPLDNKTYTANKNYSFQAQSIKDPDNDPMTVTWDFGDGTTATGETPHHTYKKAGTFMVKVTVKDGSGATASDTRVLKVKADKTSLPGFEGLVLIGIMVLVSIATHLRRQRPQGG
jgi:hypothetical protein